MRSKSIPLFIPPPRGVFVVFEGVDHSGKSTQVQRLMDHLLSKGKRVLVTREPGGSALGEEIRSLVLNRPMDSITEVLLFFAGRRDHINTVIKPALARGEWVISDRFVHSSYAYQGGGRGVPMETIDKIRALSIGDFYPDLTFTLDLTPEQMLERRQLIPHFKPDRFETEKFEFFKKTREVFLAQATSRPDRNAVINAFGTQDEVADQIATRLRNYVAARYQYFT